MRRRVSILTATTWWRVLQAAGASMLLAAVVATLDGIPIADPCEVCAQVHPWWMCLLIGCF